MKLRKLLSITLALLLVVSLLPTSALAEDISKDQDTVDSGETFENNNATVTTNNGTIVTNNDTIETNKGTVGKEGEDGNVVEGSGNNGVIQVNEGHVLTNNDDGILITNTKDGTIDTNNGFVGDRNDAGDPLFNSGTGNFGNIGVNNGEITINGKNATVDTNNGVVYENNGEVTTNDWWVGENNGDIGTNNGFVGDLDEDGFPVIDPDSDAGNFGNIGVNNGAITINGENATVDTNNFVVYENNGDIGTNNDYVETNNGDIGTNNDYVAENNGNIGTNNGEVGWNYGTVETNTIDGVVYNVTDTNGVTGEVKTNYGTIWTPTEEVNDYGWVIYEAQYGVQVQNTGSGTGNTLLQAVENFILELAELFQRDGYELVGYEDITPPSNKEYPDEEYPDGDIPAEFSLTSDPDPDTDTPELSATDFQAKRPSILSLIWKAIIKPSGGSDGGAEPTSSGNTGRISPPVLSSLSADKVSVGALIRCGKVIFKIIEVNDDSIRVATVGTLSKRNQEDMMGYLKQYLSAAQIAKFIGEPELLDADEIAQFFKDNRAHIAFYAAKDLFEA